MARNSQHFRRFVEELWYSPIPFCWSFPHRSWNQVVIHSWWILQPVMLPGGYVLSGGKRRQAQLAQALAERDRMIEAWEARHGRLHTSYHPWDWYIYLHLVDLYGIGKYTNAWILWGISLYIYISYISGQIRGKSPYFRKFHVGDMLGRFARYVSIT